MRLRGCGPVVRRTGLRSFSRTTRRARARTRAAAFCVCSTSCVAPGASGARPDRTSLRAIRRRVAAASSACPVDAQAARERVSRARSPNRPDGRAFVAVDEIGRGFASGFDEIAARGRLRRRTVLNSGVRHLARRRAAAALRAAWAGRRPSGTSLCSTIRAARRDQAGDLRVAELAQQAEDVAIDRLLPDAFARSK